MIRVAFDIDDTLYECRPKYKDQAPDHDMIGVLRWFHKNGDKVYVWSAGGLDYATQMISKLGINDYVVGAIRKDSASAKEYGITLAFDDCAEFEAKETGVTTIQVNRVHQVPIPSKAQILSAIKVTNS